ncbi:hypothetical protein [Bradyrhizobium sp. B117]|uniref:hypothetical protein n=1 Tax=Bradyrhizobium sp. B117 TaxID=3140246 RepID=UPI003183E078
MYLVDAADGPLLTSSWVFDFPADCLPDNFHYLKPLLGIPIAPDVIGAIVCAVDHFSNQDRLPHGRARSAWIGINAQ